MAMEIHDVAIITKHNSTEADKVARMIAEMLSKKGATIYTIAPLSADKATMLKSLKDLKAVHIDLAITAGGDGTTLRAVRSLADGVPVLSVKVGGSRGILSEITADTLNEGIEGVFSNSFYLDKRMRIFASIDGEEFPPALNDVLIHRMNFTRTPFYTIRFKGDELRKKMDGVIISTPTGSTGHSYSAGGPILHESMNSLLISPLNPIDRMPPLVVPLDSMEVTSTLDASIIIDGQAGFEVKPEQNIKIKRYEHDAVFLRFKSKGLRQLAKLGF